MTLELSTLSSLRDTMAAWRTAGDSVALVPTMGALHRGHLTLVERAREQAKRVIVSIFVNPTQFGPHEDFSRYPRPREQDLMMLGMEGVDAAWLPDVEEMYPSGFSTTVHVAGLSGMLDGAHRPGHFDGVATVVSKLLLQVMPDIALFGEKDYQQLCVIRRMVADLNIPVRIEGVPTVRETSGLALSSRNAYLSDTEREIAPILYRTLKKVNDSIIATVERGFLSGFESFLEDAHSELIEKGFTKIDYLALCDGNSLEPTNEYRPGTRLLAAVWLGKTRLIDNINVG